MTRFIEKLDRNERPRLLGLGDSLTYGFMVTRGYLHILRALLSDRAPEAPPTVDNEGVCGDTASGGRARLRYLLDEGGPDLALIQFGINDAFAGIHRDAYRKDLEALITSFRAARADGEVIIVPPPPAAWAADDMLLEPFRQAAAEAAEALGVGIAPVGDLFRRDHPGAFLADGVHPSEKGHGWMAQAVMHAIGADQPRV